jgi:hypothetical protein
LSLPVNPCRIIYLLPPGPARGDQQTFMQSWCRVALKDAEEDQIRTWVGKGPGEFEVPNWDLVSQKKVRDALLALGTTISDTKRMFGSSPSEVDPVRHLIGSAILWGGLPEKDAIYLNITPQRNDGSAIYKLNFHDVPVDGFWSITVYNAKGYLEPNQYNAYSLNSITAKKNADGTVDVQFGGSHGKSPNWLPTVPGWNYMVRLFRPRTEVLNGTWKFPKAQLVN